MPHILCTGFRSDGDRCLATFGIDNSSGAEAIIRGTIMCSWCGTPTGFELTKNMVTWVSGGLQYGLLNPNVPQEAKDFYGEAERSFLAATPNGVACLCRASAEIALNKAGYTQGSLSKKIEDAKKAGKLGAEEAGLAHASRLATNQSIHQGEPISDTTVPSLLSATVRVLNKLFP